MLWNTHISGGQGGRGGAGGEIDIDLAAGSTIKSAGTALRVRSIAGDGDVGGGAEASRNVFVSLTGGAGGNGGAGGVVSVTSGAQIATQGDNAIGIEAVSIGGNGGTGGVANTTNYSNHEITTGNGGNATSAGAVTVTNTGEGEIATNGDLAHAILARSVGGDGGRPGVSPNGNTDTGSLGQNQNGGLVTVTVEGGVTTQGPRSIGLFAQSLGGAGGIIGKGGRIDADVFGQIATQGGDSYGVLAQSIGGGTLFLPDRTATAGIIDTLFGSGWKDGYADDIQATLHDQGKILTHGDGAVGILAQSIGGAGGLVGGMSGVDVTQRNTATVANHNGGAGNIHISTMAGADGVSEIQTYGRRAHAIVAQTVTGGGFFAGPIGDGFSVATTACPSNCSGAAILLDLNGYVLAHGEDSFAVFAQNYGVNGASTTVNIGGNGVVASDKAVGVYIDSSGANVINNGGYLSGGWAAVDGSPATINNNYFLTGDVLARAGSHMINNRGTIWANRVLQASLHNYNYGGRIVLGSVGGQLITQITGDLVNEGDIITKIDGNGNNGQLKVFGTADIAGRVLIWGSPVDARQLVVVTAPSLTLEGVSVSLASYDYNSEQFSTVDSAFRFDVGVSGGTTLSVTPRLASSTELGALSVNQGETADHLAAAFAGGDTAYARSAFAPLYGRVSTPQDYLRFLDTIGGETLGAAAASRLTLQRSFITSMMSCPTYAETGLDLHEESCAWARVQGSWIDSKRDTGFSVDSQRYQIGAQRQLSPGWFVGASLAYEDPDIDSHAAGAHFNGDFANLGAFVKHETGRWTLAGSVSSAFGRYETRRAVMFSDSAATAAVKVQNLGLQSRVAYHASMKGWYLRPSLNVTLQYLHMNGFTETGSDFPLAVSGSGDWSLSIEPTVELGSRIAIGKTVLRPFLRGGLIQESGNDWTHEARLAASRVAFGSFTSRVDLPETSGVIAGGVEVYTSSRLSLRAEYNAELARDWTSQAAVARLSYRF